LPKKFARHDHFTQIFAQLTKRLGTAELGIALPDHFDAVDIALFDQLVSSISVNQKRLIC
jgi:hypothetical protein